MNKLTSIDYLRAFCMLFIVAFWHLFDYIDLPQGHGSALMVYVSHSVLALFVFLSGYLLGGEKTRRMSATQFYKRRLLRIYPLYLLAVAVFYAFGTNEGWTSVKALLGVSMYWQPAPLTLWFVTMLVFFYLITPLLLAVVRQVTLFAATCGAILVGTAAFMLLFNTVDPKVILYFPSFCLGIYCANYGLNNKMINWKSASLLLVPVLPVAAVQFPFETLNYLREAVLVALLAYLVFNLCASNEAHFRPSPIVTSLSYSSFAMYLFHRPVYISLEALYVPESVIMQLAYFGLLGLALVAVIAWSLQRLYDYTYASIRDQVQPAGSTAAGG